MHHASAQDGWHREGHHGMTAAAAMVEKRASGLLLSYFASDLHVDLLGEGAIADIMAKQNRPGRKQY